MKLPHLPERAEIHLPGRRRIVELLNRRRVSAEAVPTVDHRQLGRDVLEDEGPVESRIPATDEEDLFVSIGLRIFDRIVDARAKQLVIAGTSQMTGLEGALATGDHDGLGAVVGGTSAQHEVVSLSLERGDLLVEHHLGLELHGLLDHVLGKVLRQNLRDAADVEDVLLGIEGGQLPAQLREGVDDATADPSEAGVEGPEEAGRPTPDDGDVRDVVLHVLLSQRSRARSP